MTSHGNPLWPSEQGFKIEHFPNIYGDFYALSCFPQDSKDYIFYEPHFAYILCIRQRHLLHTALNGKPPVNFSNIALYYNEVKPDSIAQMTPRRQPLSGERGLVGVALDAFLFETCSRSLSGALIIYQGVLLGMFGVRTVMLNPRNSPLTSILCNVSAQFPWLANTESHSRDAVSSDCF